MQIGPEIAAQLRDGHTVFEVTGACIGIRKVRRVWFVLASGHYVADCGSCYMCSNGAPDWEWAVVPETAPVQKRKLIKGG